MTYHYQCEHSFRACLSKSTDFRTNPQIRHRIFEKAIWRKKVQQKRKVINCPEPKNKSESHSFDVWVTWMASFGACVTTWWVLERSAKTEKEKFPFLKVKYNCQRRPLDIAKNRERSEIWLRADIFISLCRNLEKFLCSVEWLELI